MPDFLPAAQTFFAVIALAAYLTLVGWSLAGIYSKQKKTALALGGGYFLGVCGFLSFVHFFSIFSQGFVESVLLFFLLSLGWIIVCLRKQGAVFKGLPSSLAAAVIPVLAGLFVVALIWVYPQAYGPQSSPHASFGSIESGRYANIAAYILSENIIPVLSQNYGQSVLAAATGIAGVDRLVFALFLWLSLSVWFLAILLFGLFYQWTENRNFSLAAAFAVLFGGTALTWRHMLAVDSVTPYAYNGYSDSILGIGSWLLLVCWLAQYIKGHAVVSRGAALVALLVPAWMYGAPQNIIAGAVVIAFLAFAGFVAQPSSLIPYKTRRNAALILAVVFAVLCLLLRPYGGFFTPPRFQDQVSIPGLLSLSQGAKLMIQPGLEYLMLHGTQPGFSFQHIVLPPFSLGAPVDEMIGDFFIRFIKAAWVLFFPFVGALLMGRSLIIAKSPRLKAEAEMSACFGLIAFGACFSLVFLFSVSGQKWPMSRFLLPGMIWGQICWCLYIWSEFRDGSFLKRGAGYALLLLPVLAPMITLAYRLAAHTPFLFSSGAKTLFSLSGTIGGE